MDARGIGGGPVVAHDDDERRRRRNVVVTAVALALVAVAFYVGFIVVTAVRG